MNRPRRTEYLPFAVPEIDGEEIQGVTDVLKSGWLTTGARTREFEKRFAARVGAKHALAVNSCTAALHLALEAAGVGPGSEVLTSPYTFAATGEVIRYLGARPVFADIDPLTLNIDPACAAGAVSPRTRALVPVHIAGLPADMTALQAVCAGREIALVDDAAHAFPAASPAGQVGTGTTATCFSFYATKTITTGEGGMITTDSDALADRCRIMSLHGISRDAWKRYTAEGSWYYEIVDAGYKYNMTDVAAAIGIAQLAKADRMLQRRREIAARFDEAFAAFGELQLPARMAGYQHAWHLYQLRLNLRLLNCDRNQFIDELRARNIGASVHFIPLHVHPYYRDAYGYRAEDFPVSYREYLREISLPIYSKMTDEDVDDVIAAVVDVTARHASASSVLA